MLDFGSLYCCKHKVLGIAHYNLSDTLDLLYTDSKDKKTLHFWENARIYNNGMAMSSLACERKWRSRTNNYKQESMLTAYGELKRYVGPIAPGKVGRTSSVCKHTSMEDQKPQDGE